MNSRIGILLCALVTSACSRRVSESAPPPAALSAVPAASTVASATPEPSASVTPALSASTPPTPSRPVLAIERVFDVDYEGTIGPSQIYVQLSQDGTKGRYFYGKRQGFLDLAGRLGNDGVLTVRERSGGKQTGTFTLKRDADSFTGDWESADKKRKFPISLRAIVRKPGDPVVLVTREIHGSRAAKEPASFGRVDASTCVVDLKYHQLLGLADRKLQAELDARFRPPETLDCTAPGVMSGGPTVYMNERGVLSVEYGWGYVEAGRARGESLASGGLNALVDRGIVDVPVNRILDTANLERIRKLLERTIDSGQHVTPQQPLPQHIRDRLVDTVIQAPDIRLSPKGVVFCPEAGFPQAFDALQGCQYVIAFDKLESILDRESPASFLWNP
jgi:hypothetical protein